MFSVDVDCSVELHDDVHLILDCLCLEGEAERGKQAGVWIVVALAAKVVLIDVVIGRTLTYAIVVVPECALTPCAVCCQFGAFCTNRIAFLAGD